MACSQLTLLISIGCCKACNTEEPADIGNNQGICHYYSLEWLLHMYFKEGLSHSSSYAYEGYYLAKWGTLKRRHRASNLMRFMCRYTIWCAGTILMKDGTWYISDYVWKMHELHVMLSYMKFNPNFVFIIMQYSGTWWTLYSGCECTPIYVLPIEHVIR